MRFEVSGYVLAGGKSSRMGRDKALLELHGRPLVELAVEKLRIVCRDVHILSSQAGLIAFAPLLGDLHTGCGPMGGIEAALLHASCPWSLFLPVDMPFLPVEFLTDWLGQVLLRGDARVALFTIGERPQPTLCMVHRDVLPFVQQAVSDQKYRLYPVLEFAARGLALARGLKLEDVLVSRTLPDEPMFANLNTPEEFTEAERRTVGARGEAPLAHLRK